MKSLASIFLPFSVNNVILMFSPQLNGVPFISRKYSELDKESQIAELNQVKCIGIK